MTASTVAFTQRNLGPSVRDIVATVVCNSVDGTFTATALPLFSGRLLALRTNPGGTAPTANYDIQLLDADGVDRLQAVGMNRHTTNSEEVAVVYSGTAIHPAVVFGESLSLTITNNSVNSAQIVARVVYSVDG